MTDYNEDGHKVKSTGAEGFLLFDFSKVHDTWVNVTNDSDDVWDDYDLPTPDEAIKAAKEWRDGLFEEDVVREKRRIRVRNEAVLQVAAEDRKPFVPPLVWYAREFLARPLTPQQHRIEDLWPIGGNVLFAAGAKWGKSSCTANLLRSMADGDAFLGHFECAKIVDGETILLVDLEMNEERVQTEIMAQGIENLDCLRIMCLRGSAEQFDITNDEAFEFLTAYCKQENVKTLIIDPLAPLLGLLGLDENDNSVITKFFQQLDTLKLQAGIRDMLVTHHCGHSPDLRPRGASRFNDWPDAIWLGKREKPTDPSSPRKFFARGRDVGQTFQGAGRVDQDAANPKILLFDAASASVAVGDAALKAAIEHVLYVAWEAANKYGQSFDGMDKNAISTACDANDAEMTNGKRDKLLTEMVASGQIHKHQMAAVQGRPYHYWVSADQCSQC